MVNPDNTKINYIPPDEGDAYEEHPVTPVRSSDKASKDFKKILGRGSREGKEGDGKKSPAMLFSEDHGMDGYNPQINEKTDKDDIENATQGANVFDPSKITDFKETPSKASTVSKVESPSDLFKRMSSSTPARKEAIKKETMLIQDKLTSRFNTEHVDLSYVNPLATQNQMNTQLMGSFAETKVEQSAGVDPNLPSLINQIEKYIETMYTVKKMGQTDTVLTLENPPLFKGAQITVSAFDSAKNEFNISIANLTQQAQKILDLEANKYSLLHALENKGYNIHVFTTTTAEIQHIALPEEQASQNKDQRHGGSQQHDQSEG